MSYWINNFIFELLKYYIIGGICLVLLKAFGYYEDYLVILYLLYGPPMVAFTYIIGCLVKREGTGQVLVILMRKIYSAYKFWPICYNIFWRSCYKCDWKTYN